MNNTFRSPLFLMALTIFIDFAGFGLILPLLPFWAEHLGANPLEVGLILTLYALAQFIFTPLLGALADRFGRKPIIVVSLLIEAFSLALSGLAGSLVVLLIARFLGGIGASNIGSAQAVVAIVNALLVLSFLPETHKERGASKTGSSAKKGSGIFLIGVGQLLRNTTITRFIVINLLFTMAFTAIEAVFALFSQQRFGWTAKENGYMFTYVGCIVVIMQGGLIGQLVKRFGERTLLVASLLEYS